MSPDQVYHLHLISDSTGETVSSVARACLVQFEKVQVKEHLWSLVRSTKQIEKIALAVAAEPGPVIFTLIDDQLKQVLVEHCRRLKVPFIPVLDPVMSTLTRYFHSAMSGAPGRQHSLDAEYFARIDAMHYTLAHDDGQALHDLNDADVILVGPSRTSKTPTCVYLANRGIKAANVPLVPEIAMPSELDHASHPLIVGLVTDAERLVQVRRNRLRLLQQSVESEYTDPELVEAEMLEAKRLFARKKWPVVDVSRRSIEETAAAVIQMLSERRAKADAAAGAALS